MQKNLLSSRWNLLCARRMGVSHLYAHKARARGSLSALPRQQDLLLDGGFHKSRFGEESLVSCGLCA